MKSIVTALILASAAPLPAQPLLPAVIRVVGNGSIRVDPDVAIISYGLRGEGASSDDAVRVLTVKRAAIDDALAGRAQVHTGKLVISVARDKAFDGNNGDAEDRVRLSTGPCAIKGYVATLQLTARIKPVADAGTLLGLISRLGATNPSLSDFELSDPASAQRAAVDAAVRDGRQQANLIAAASGSALGKLRRVEDARATTPQGDEIVVSAMRAPPPEVQPPMQIKIAPEPIETTATLNMEFELGAPKT